MMEGKDSMPSSELHDKDGAISIDLEESDHVEDVGHVMTEAEVVQEQLRAAMPWRKLTIILLVIACDGMALNIISPFVSDMVRDFGIEEKFVGAAAGFLLGAFSFAVFCSGFFLGHFSDTYGRKPMLVMGLFTGVVCTVWFGLSPTYFIALVSRLVAGGTNSNIGISKAAIADVTSGKNRQLSLAYIGGTFSFSRALASAVAGIFTGVLIPGVPLYDTNPYLFPCTIAAALNAFALVFVVVFLPETLRNKAPICGAFSGKKGGKAQPGAETSRDIEEGSSKDQTTVVEGDDTPDPVAEVSPSLGAVVWNKLTKNNFMLGMDLIIRDPLLRKLILLVMINGFCNGGINLAMILLFSLPIENHGLGFSPFYIGVVFLYFGLSASIFQVTCIKPLMGRLGAPNTYRMGVACLGFGTFWMAYVIVPYWMFGVSWVTVVAAWFGIFITVSFVSVGFMTAIPMLNSMVSNSAPLGRQGLTMGSAQSMSSLLRAIGPALSGVVFSISVAFNFPFLLFWLLTLGYIACVIITCTFSEADLHRMVTTPIPLNTTGTVEEVEEVGLELEVVHLEEDSLDDGGML